MDPAITIDLLNPDKEALVRKWAHELAIVAPLNKWDLNEELAWWAEYATGRTEILELGAYNGASTKIMALANPSLRIFVIDTWDDPGTQDNFRAALAGEIKSSRVRPWWATTENGLRQLLEDRVNAFDGLLVDAGHTKELVWTDIVLGMQLMKPGTLICGHDYHPAWSDNGVSQAVIELLPGHTNPCESIWAYQMPKDEDPAA